MKKQALKEVINECTYHLPPTVFLVLIQRALFEPTIETPT